MTALYLIDAIGPFFRGYDRRTINWSKIPWEFVGLQGAQWWEATRQEMTAFAAKVAACGFNAVSIDDVSHLAEHPWLEPEIRSSIARYRVEMKRCFEILRDAGLGIFVTMDVFSATQGLLKKLACEGTRVNDYLRELLDQFLTDFPEVTGVIVRIGEADGKDVRDDFRSQLVIRHPRQARAFLEDLLPIFDRHNRKLIFRTWTVGAYRIGDLMWHRETFANVFKGLDSPALIVSMKYGETDFFRYLPLNRNFFRTPLPKIVELQTRREYEGCGEYPSFIGWDYERYARELRQAQNLVGCMVWCQTGGWVPFRRRAFLDKEALWTELNTYVTLRLLKDQWQVEDAVRAFVQERKLGDGEALIELLRLSDESVRELLYVEEFARQKLFFRRVRIPPLLQVYWGNIFISHSVRKVLRCFVHDAEGALSSAQRCLQKLDLMPALAERAGVPVEDIEYMRDTFRMLALAREYYFSAERPEMEARLRAEKKAYKAKYAKRGVRPRYRIKMDFKPVPVGQVHLGWALKVLLRRQRGYRMVDRLVVLHVLALVYRVIATRRPHWIPAFARGSAMGVETVLK